jgi:LuxR family maltose regulon positive regulatory protein
MWQKENTEELLEEIIRRNAFVNHDEKNGTFQVHKIFSEFLQELLKQMNEPGKNKLYCLAAKWYEETGEYISALRYYYVAGDWDSLLGILEEDQGHSMINEYREELISYYEECPALIREKHPVALLVIAICFFSYNEVQRFARVCEEIGSLLQRNLPIENHTIHEIAGELELLLSFTKYNDLEKMGEHIKAASNLLEQPSKFMDTRGGWTFGSPSVLYMFHREAGQLEKELELMKEMLPYYEKIAKGHGTGADQVMEAEICYMRGEFDNAEILAYKAIYKASIYKQQDIVICAVFLQLRIALCRGDYAFIVNNLEKIRKQSEKEKWYHLLDTIELCHAYIKTCLGQKQNIPEWIMNGNYASSKLYFPAVAFFNIVYEKVLLVQEDYHKFLGSKDYFVEMASIFPNLLAQIYIHIYSAAAYEKLHRRDSAQEELEKALKLASPDLILMPFVENCNMIEPLLLELQLFGKHKAFVCEILKLYNPYKGAINSILAENYTKEKSVLADRETEVAKLVAQGLSNREIGLQLYISTNTVKTILKRIFDKLGINSRNMLKQYIET